MHQLVRMSLLLLTLGGASASPAIAQEQENPSTPGQIADPSTYQGSTVLQQQSDQQDQQFRQQQQQQSQSYGGQSYGQYSPRYGGNAGAAPPMMPSGRCNVAMERSPSLAPLRGLVSLGVPSNDPRLFAISRGPTAAEKPVLMRWLAARHHCQTLANGFSPEVQQVNARAAHITDSMILALVRGEGNYGKFNYVRVHNNMVLQNFRESH